MSIGSTSSGKRRRKVLIGRSKADVQQKLARLQQRSPLWDEADAGSLTLAQYLHHWLESDARQRCRASTLSNHERAIRRELVPQLGKMPLARLSPLHIQSMLADMAERGKSPFTRNSVRKTLHRALNRALNRATRLGLIPQNPCSLVETAREPRRPPGVLTPEAVARFFAAAEPDRLYALYVVAVTTGLRQGDLFGLRWEDVDLDADALVVQRALDRSLEFAEPKTAHSRRRVELPRMTVDVLLAHQAAMTAEGHGRGSCSVIERVRAVAPFQRYQAIVQADSRCG